MNDINELTDLEFRVLLQKKESPIPSATLSNAIMEQVYRLEVKPTGYLKYINRSWFFIALAVLLSLYTISSFSLIQMTFANYINYLIPGLYDCFSIVLVTLIASLFLYQWNQLLTYRFQKVSISQ